MGFLKSIVKLGGFASGGWLGGLLADKHTGTVAQGLGFASLGLTGGLLAKELLQPKVSAQLPEPVGAPQRSAQFVDRRDPFNRDDFAEFSLRRDLDQFRIPLIDLFQS